MRKLLVTLLSLISSSVFAAQSVKCYSGSALIYTAEKADLIYFDNDGTLKVFLTYETGKSNPAVLIRNAACVITNL